MRILLTNDDGIDAPGLIALYDAIAPAHRVTVVAPVRERSSCGHAATLTEPLRVQRRRHDRLGETFAVDGTPADCVRLAVAELVREPIDCVLSGVNRGANVSVVDVSQSGTVAAAREAAFCGLLGIAVSQMYRKGVETDWSRAANVARALVPQLIDAETPPGCFWNVNIPAPGPDPFPTRVRIVPLCQAQIPLAFASEEERDDGVRAFQYRGFYEARASTPDTDVAVVFGNEVAVTPMSIDPTHPMMNNLAPTLHL